MNRYSIVSSVGKAGRNNKLDVKVIQTLLNKQNNQLKLNVDGDCGKSTIEGIEWFQKNVERMMMASGQVIPGGQTFLLLEKSAIKAYSISDNSVVLGVGVEDIIKPIAFRFYCNTSPNKSIVITSGYRSPIAQAKAMFTKLELKDDLVKLYKNKAAAMEVKVEYDTRKKNKETDAAIVSGIQAVLEGQVAKGIYISSHLNSKAFDVRSRDMSSNDIILFRKVCDGFVQKFLHELKPPHLHLEL